MIPNSIRHQPARVSRFACFVHRVTASSPPRKRTAPVSAEVTSAAARPATAASAGMGSSSMVSQYRSIIPAATAKAIMFSARPSSGSSPNQYNSAGSRPICAPRVAQHVCQSFRRQPSGGSSRRRRAGVTSVSPSTAP